MRDKTCPDCGDELATLPWGRGTVWQCGDHGVKEWYFEDERDTAWPTRPAAPPELLVRPPDLRRR